MVVAHRVARERAEVAASLEERVLHLAILTADEDGLATEETAAALHVPVAVVRHHLSDDYAVPAPPADGTNGTWREATRAVWAHDPEILRDQWGPFPR
ncbi:hypothetical protein [Microbacterium gorillae]|uniref:hypothetical protein n=1 Tax=Microbacterium gorillae TaxID=1231063 RepID=UPI003D95FFEB